MLSFSSLITLHLGAPESFHPPVHAPGLFPASEGSGRLPSTIVPDCETILPTAERSLFENTSLNASPERPLPTDSSPGSLGKQPRFWWVWRQTHNSAAGFFPSHFPLQLFTNRAWDISVPSMLSAGNLDSTSVTRLWNLADRGPPSLHHSPRQSYSCPCGGCRTLWGVNSCKWDALLPDSELLQVGEGGCIPLMSKYPEPTHSEGLRNFYCMNEWIKAFSLQSEFLFFPLWLHLQHMEVPRLGVQLELHLPAYVTATAMPDPQGLHLSLKPAAIHRSLIHWVRPGIEFASSKRQHWVLNPLSHNRNSKLSEFN